MLHDLIRIWFEWVHDWGYVGVFLLMAMESSIFPVPSEVVMPPAAFWAAQGRMDFAGVVIAGTAGSYFGSLVTYLVSRWVGLPVVSRFGRYFFMPPEKIAMASGWVSQYGPVGVFVARLLPVVRHLISIPAGILKMDLKVFSLVTTFGAGIWCWILAWFGRKVLGDHPELLNSPQEMVHVMKEQLGWFVGAVVAFGVFYALMSILKKRIGATTANHRANE